MEKILRAVLRFAAVLLAAPAALLLSGCASQGYYQEQAVVRARDFLFKECPEIPLYEQEYIKFNRPFFLVAPITKGYETGMSQICITWMVPDNPDLYMVYGASGARMIQWEPIRVIRKNFNQPDKNYFTAVDQVRNDLLQNQFGLLSTDSINHIRYSLPGVWRTTFPLDLNPDLSYPPDKLAKAEMLPRFVIAWKVMENGAEHYILGGGTAIDDKMTGFKRYFSGIFTAEDFRAGLVDAAPVIAPFGGTMAE